MALINQQGMYNGTPALNPLPYVNIAMQARARKAAREEAIDKYYQNLPNTINDKDIRDQEIEVLNAMKSDIVNTGVKNRELLRKGDGAAIQELDKKFRAAQTYAQESKNRTATAKKLAQLRGNPKYDYIFRDPKLIEKIEKHERAVGSEGSEPINFDQLTFPPAPFDRAKYVSGIKVKPNPTTPIYQDIPGDKFNRLEITGKSFSPEDLNAIHISAQSELENNPSFEKEIKENIQTNPAKAALMADIFQKHFGHKIETEEDLAAAYTLSLLDITPTQRVTPNKQAITEDKNAEWNRRNKLTYAQSLAKIRLNNQNRKEGLPTEDTGYISDEVAEEVGVTEVVELNGKTRDVKIIYTDKTDPQRLKIITSNGAVKPIPIKQKDGSIKMGYYQDRETGDWEGLGKDDKPAVISREAAKDRYVKEVSPTKFKTQVGTKASENTKGDKTTTKPKADPLGLGF